MKNFILFLILILLSSCGKDSENIIDYTPDPVNPVDTTTLQYFYDTYCYGYKVKDTTALRVMGINKEIPYTQIDIKEGTIYLSGTRNGKLWIAGFETESKEQNFEFVDSKPMELTCKLHLGYGEYKDITIDKTEVVNITENSPNIISYINVYNKAPEYYTGNAKYITFYTPSSSRTYFTQTAYGETKPIKWYNDSYLIGGLNTENPYKTSHIYTCMTQTGDTVFTIKNTGMQNFAVDPAFPINYKEAIFFNSDYIVGNPAIRITKRNIDFPDANSAWEIFTPITYLLADAKYSITKKEISETIWQFTIDILWYNGEKGNYSYKIDINTGELTNKE